MSSRKEEKERLRRERQARERAALAAERRGRWTRYAASGILAVAVAAIVVAAITAGGAGTSGTSTTRQASSALQTGAPPWPPETSGLQARLAGLDLPPEGGSYHAHAVLRVFVDGQQVGVPENIGIDPASGTMASLHTHDDSGKIHIEAAQDHAFTLDHFFRVWGVQFRRQQLGGLKATSDKTLEVFANGKPVDPRTYALKDNDKLVVAYGKPGSAPRTFS